MTTPSIAPVDKRNGYATPDQVEAHRQHREDVNVALAVTVAAPGAHVMLRAEQASKLLGIHNSEINRLTARGLVHAHEREDGHRWYDVEEIRAASATVRRRRSPAEVAKGAPIPPPPPGYEPPKPSRAVIEAPEPEPLPTPAPLPVPAPEPYPEARALTQRDPVPAPVPDWGRVSVAGVIAAASASAAGRIVAVAETPASLDIPLLADRFPLIAQLVGTVGALAEAAAILRKAGRMELAALVEEESVGTPFEKEVLALVAFLEGFGIVR